MINRYVLGIFWNLLPGSIHRLLRKLTGLILVQVRDGETDAVIEYGWRRVDRKTGAVL